MYGAILGDIIGSPFEFDRGDKTKEFDLFSKGCRFTDDSVMTIAIGEALLAVGTEATGKEIEVAVAANMQDWGRRYPHAGYGGRFRCWLSERNPKPYGSYGNGSAMRDIIIQKELMVQKQQTVQYKWQEMVLQKKKLKSILKKNFVMIWIEV